MTQSAFWETFFMQRSKYRILGKVGQGQFGRVFCAVHRQTGELVALKDLDQRRFPTNRFLRELSCLVSLQHPNIVTCQALEHNQTGRYLVMDYCEGGTLRDLMESGHLSLPQSLNLIADILLGLEHSHKRQIVHCDIKPENILLNLIPNGWIARLSDFGIARLSQSLSDASNGGSYTGSPAYMAPERFYGQCSPASDLYAVGVILFELVVGERPFSGIPSQLMSAHLNQWVDLPDLVPSVLRETIAKALQKLPQRRFACASEMLQSLRLAMEKLTVTYFPPTPIQSSSSALEIIHEESLSAPITHLAVDAGQVYLGMTDQVYCQTYTDSPLSGKLLQQWHVKLPAPIIALHLQTQTCLTITHSPNHYSIWGLSRERGECTALLSVKTSNLISAVAPQGHWLSIIYSLTSNLASFQILKLPELQSIQTLVNSALPSQLIILDNYHGLAIFSGQTEANLTRFQLFNRRGGWINGFCLPLTLQLITSSATNPYRLLAVEQQETAWGVLINLKPLKVTRIALDIMPAFIVAQAWGYLLANRQGQVVLLNQEGETIERFNVPPITAIAACSKSGFLIATWLENQGVLYKINVRFNHE